MANDALKAQAKKDGKRISTKRQAIQPRAGYVVKTDQEPAVLRPLVFEVVC